MDNQNNRPRPMRRGPMRGAAEKPKDFKTAIKKLIRYSKTFWPAILVAVILAAISSVMTIAGPDQISKITWRPL